MHHCSEVPMSPPGPQGWGDALFPQHCGTCPFFPLPWLPLVRLWSLTCSPRGPVLVLSDLCITNIFHKCMWKSWIIQALLLEEKRGSSGKFIHLFKVMQPEAEPEAGSNVPACSSSTRHLTRLPHMGLHPKENWPELPPGAQGHLKSGSNIQESLETSWRAQRHGCPKSAGQPYPCGVLASRAFFSLLPAIQRTVRVSPTRSISFCDLWSQPKLLLFSTTTHQLCMVDVSNQHQSLNCYCLLFGFLVLLMQGTACPSNYY